MTIAAVADRGRGLVAVRDVAAGELILRDRAVVTLARGVTVEEAGHDITLLQRQVMLSQYNVHLSILNHLIHP